MFHDIEATAEGLSTVRSLGFDKMERLVGRADLVGSLVRACWRTGYRVKVVKQELSIFSSRVRSRTHGIFAFYVSKAKAAEELGFFFVPHDKRLAFLDALPQAGMTKENYVAYSARTAQQVEEFFAAVHTAEMRVIPGRLS